MWKYKRAIVNKLNRKLDRNTKIRFWQILTRFQPKQFIQLSSETETVESPMKMAEEMKGKLSEAKETVKEEIDDYKEKASEGMDAVKEKTSEVLKTVKGETEEETDCRIFFTFALMAALGSGCLAHKATTSLFYCCSPGR